MATFFNLLFAEETTEGKIIMKIFSIKTQQIMKERMRISFVTTFLTGFQRKSCVKNNIPVDKESYIDEKIKDYIDTQVLVRIREEEVELATTKEE